MRPEQCFLISLNCVRWSERSFEDPADELLNCGRISNAALGFVGKIFEQKERALTSPKTSALAFISVLPWRINDGEILNFGTRF